MIKKEITKEDLILNKTCGCAPEQYDVLIKDKDNNEIIIGYIRLRHGFLSADYVKENHYIEIYTYYFDEDFKGCFDNEDERIQYLEIIKEKLIEYHNTKII